jgi:uncharacterized protein (TIGR03437 family)
LYSAVRCKQSPAIYFIGPLITGTAKMVQAGANITVTGIGFGAQQCSTCRVTAANPNATNLPVSSWSDSTITATLPASFGTGIATIGVTTANGYDAINVMAGVPPPTISLSPPTLTFFYTAGGPIPPAQSFTVSNSGGGALAYTAVPSVAWITATPVGANITVTVNPAGLGPLTYQGTVLVTVPGTSNSPQAVLVTLVMLAPPLTISAVTNSATGLAGGVAPGELVSIFGTNLGPATGVSFSVNSAGMVGTSLAGTQVTFGSVAAPVLYSSATQINVVAPYELAGQAQATMTVQYQGASASRTLSIQSASPGAYTLNSSGSGPVVAANQDYSINGPSNPATKGSYVTIYFTGGGQTNPSGVTGSVTGSVLKWLTQAISVTVGNQPAFVGFDGSAPTFVDGVDQLNIQLSPNTPSGAQPVVITIGGVSSPGSVTLAVQ